MFAYFQMIKQSALCYAQNIPNTLKIGLVLILHATQSFININYSLFEGLHF